VVLGHSAGGHLALWVAARPHFATNHPLYTPNAFAFKGVVALAPVADLVRAWELGLSDTVVEELLGGNPSSHPTRYAAASPIALVPLQLPQILVHGAQDDIVPLEISEQYMAAARAAGDDCRLERLENAGHFEVIDPFSLAWATVQAAVESLIDEKPSSNTHK
jgi:dipeptidyl aminopeptidase/acylaminoacyl peptidase